MLHELGRLYHALGDHENEVEIYNRLTAINPLDAQALRLGKDASARASMKRGGWTQAETYRDLIKDKDKSHFTRTTEPDPAPLGEALKTTDNTETYEHTPGRTRKT